MRERGENECFIFLTTNNHQVFQETISNVNLVGKHIDEKLKKEDITSCIVNMTEINFKLALFVISAAAFGKSLEWDDKDNEKKGKKEEKLPEGSDIIPNLMTTF